MNKEVNLNLYNVIIEFCKVYVTELIMADVQIAQPIIGSTLPIDEIKLQSAIKRRTIYLTEAIDSDSVFKTIYFLDRIRDIDERNEEKELKPITIRLNTPGGFVNEGFALMGRIQEMQKIGYKFTIIAEGLVASMGIPILLMGDERVCHKYDRFMIHSIAGGAIGKIDDIKAMFKDMDECQEMFLQIYDEYAKIPKSEIESHKYIDWFFGSDIALEYAIVNRII